MRLPRYARGLQIARFGVYGMLVMLGFSIALVIKSITASSETDAMDVFDYLKYTQWANLAAVGAMLVGTLLAVPDFLAAKMSLTRIVIAVLCFGVTLLVVWWSYRAIAGFVDAALDADLEALEGSVKKLESLPYLTVLKDIAYTLGLVMIVRSIRQTAVANDHYALRDAASTVSGLVGGMLAADVLYQLMYGLGRAGVTFALLGFLLGVSVLAYWVYCHLRLAKFLKAASILVHEPHNLPVARVVSTASDAKPAARTSGAIAKPSPMRASGPIPRPSGPKMSSGPVVTPTAFGMTPNAGGFGMTPAVGGPSHDGPSHGGPPSGGPPSGGPSSGGSSGVVEMDAVTQPSGPLATPTASRPGGPIASGPVVPVAAEIRHAPAPRANTATAVPGLPDTDGPKFLK
jgi:hypothetical protein